MTAIGVTGAGGFIGSHLVSVLESAGHTVNRLKDDGPFDAVVHCAAVHGDASIADMVAVNAMGTVQAIASAILKKAKTFVYLSTVSIYGEINSETVDEDTPIINPSPYGISKYLGELAACESPMRALNIRCCGVIGDGAHRNWLSRVLKSAQLGEEIVISNPEAQFNNAVHVADLCQFISGAIEDQDWDGHQTVTVGADGMSTVWNVVGTILDMTGRKSGIRLTQGHKPFTVSSECAKAMGYRPQHIDAMVRRFVTESGRA